VDGGHVATASATNTANDDDDYDDGAAVNAAAPVFVSNRRCARKHAHAGTDDAVAIRPADGAAKC